MKALIFGSNGQDGFYLRELLKKNKVEVTGFSRRNAEVIGEVQDRGLVERVIKSIKPDYVFHLAANSTTRHSAVWENHETISTGTFNILETVLQFSPETKVFLSGSGLQFENIGLPIDETAPFVATSPYVVSRNQSVYAARYYRSLGLKVYVGYFFNHDSPRRPSRHMAQKVAYYCSHLARQTEKLTLGNVTVKKEWTYAGDIVEALWVLVNQDVLFECVIGSGQAYSIEDWLKICFGRIGKDWKNHVDIMEGFVPEYEILVSNPVVLKSLGWSPKVSIYQLAELMVDE